MTDPLEPEWLDQKAAAARLSVSPRTLRSWTSRGLIAVHQLPGAVRRYRISELDALASPCERQAG